MKPKRLRGEAKHLFELRAAIDTITRIGVSRYHKIESNSDYARAFGVAIAPYFTDRAIVLLAAEALEDRNAHSAAGMLRSMLTGGPTT